MTEEQSLRKWCLEWAFQRRRETGVWHLQVTNEADEYFQFIMNGDTQAKQAFRAARAFYAAQTDSTRTEEATQ